MPPARARCSVEEPNSALVPPGGISHLRVVCVVTFPYFLSVGYAACEERFSGTTWQGVLLLTSRRANIQVPRGRQPVKNMAASSRLCTLPSRGRASN